MTRPLDDIVVGAGILGLATASRLMARGRQVLVLERSDVSQGASIRNFGMIWPIGQPPGERLDTALASRSLWLDALQRSRQWYRTSGSLHVAHHAEEVAVLEEFAALSNDAGYRARLLSSREALAISPRLRPDDLRCALLSDTEVNVDARAVLPGLVEWLRNEGVGFQFGCTVQTTEDGTVETTSGPLRADRVWVCPGERIHGFIADPGEETELIRTKLQMLSMGSLAPGDDMGPMLAAGLTLAHYDAFAGCPSLPALRRSLRDRHPFATAHGIHVMVSQNSVGELVLGDSHVYGADIDPFDREDIEAEILGLLGTFVKLDDLRITRRWHGTYIKCAGRPWWVADTDPRTTVLTGVGGAGMTLSFGLAERIVSERLGPPGG